ncbi:ABC transporter substrate-binding protein [Lacrimispora sp. NSJ-141]|uniref:ABC transporter substrate-binding protein n=1 Tax=Lientehia hominis TaxID=2897778 RepID=A0AAP2RL54_9FIRM|nr:ABC transporter substrate-binding protein [Lientehia hominis]MCD2493654.1 ABC transporter substrate-binding protein [Lientehia hominis]
MKLKKLVAVSLAAVMALSMAACGKKDDKPADSTTKAAGTEAGKTDEGKKEEGGSEAASGETFKLGTFLQLTGANSVAGNESNNTLDMVIDYINEKGGFNGAKIEKVVYDSQGSPEEAVKVVSKLINDDKVDAIVGSVNSSEILAAGQQINDAGVFMMGLGTANTWMAEDWPYVFRATVNNASLATNTADMIVEAGFKNVAVVNGQDDASLSTADAFIEICKGKDIEVLTRETYAAADTDFSAQVAKIVAADPQCVYMTCSGEHIGPFVKQLRQGGYKGILYSKEIMSMRDANIAGNENAKYVAASYPYLIYASIDDCDVDAIKEVLQMYEDRYGEIPTTEVIYRVWDTMMVMWEASKVAGSNDSDALKDAMAEVKVDGLGGPLTYDDGTREGYHTSNDWIYIGDGKNKDYTKWLEEDYDTYKSDTGREY